MVFLIQELDATPDELMSCPACGGEIIAVLLLAVLIVLLIALLR